MSRLRIGVTAIFTAALVAIALTGTASAKDYRGDRDGNPPGWIGGPGTNWENPPGRVGGPGVSPDWRHHRRPVIVIVQPNPRWRLHPGAKARVRYHYWHSPRWRHHRGARARFRHHFWH